MANGAPVKWPALSDLVEGFFIAWLILTLWAEFGMALGVVLRYPAAAIGGGLAYVFLIELLLGEILRNVAGLDEILKFCRGSRRLGWHKFFATPCPSLAQGPLLSTAHEV